MFGMIFSCVSKTHLDLWLHTIGPKNFHKRTIVRSQICGVDKLEESPTAGDNGVVDFVTADKSLRGVQIFAVEEFFVDKISALDIARMVDKMHSLAPCENNIVFVENDCGGIRLGAGCRVVIIH